jgi:hypothetical protein
MKVRQARFEIHRAQKTAAIFLLVFLLQTLWLMAHLPLSLAETRSTLAGQQLWSSRQLVSNGSPLIPGDSVLTLRCAGLLPSIARHWQTSAAEFSIYAAPNRWLVRLPFAFFGLWLGAALWWVARRLFSDLGGYVALALYCFSPPMLIAGATANSAILAAWGLFGLIFTATGVAHTLYAPARKWRLRIALLGTAIGLTAAANIDAAIAGLIFATVFMIYLSPHRRLLALAILAMSCALGALVFLLCFGFNLRDLRAAAVFPNHEIVRLTFERLKFFGTVPGGLLEIFAFLVCVLVFLFWKRTRYFGNAAPLMVASFLPCWPGRFASGASMVWALPFAFVFVGGVYADLLEPGFFSGRFRRLVAATALVLSGASLLLGLTVVAGA